MSNTKHAVAAFYDALHQDISRLDGNSAIDDRVKNCLLRLLSDAKSHVVSRGDVSVAFEVLPDFGKYFDALLSSGYFSLSDFIPKFRGTPCNYSFENLIRTFFVPNDCIKSEEVALGELHTTQGVKMYKEPTEVEVFFIRQLCYFLQESKTSLLNSKS